MTHHIDSVGYDGSQSQHPRSDRFTRYGTKYEYVGSHLTQQTVIVMQTLFDNGIFVEDNGSSYHSLLILH